MPRNGAGLYSLPPVYQAVPGTTIRAEQHNAPLEDIAAALTNSLPRDGQAPMTGDLPMGSNKITGLAAGTNPADAVRFDQLPPALTGWLASVSALALTANQFPYATDATTAAAADLSAFGRDLIDDADAPAARTTLGLGTLATVSPTGTPDGTKFLADDYSLKDPTPYGRIMAWVCFNGTGTVAILASANVSSITDNGNGDYTVNFTTNMPDTNYGVVGFAANSNNTTPAGLMTYGSDFTRGVGSVRVKTVVSGTYGLTDAVYASVVIVR